MKFLFCSGSNASSKAAEGSPLKSEPNLSISSRRITGFILPAFFIAFINFPGNAPIYVLLCPLISASSRTPPRLILTKFLFIASAIDLASDVFPTPGGPTKHKIGPLTSSDRVLTARNSKILSFGFSSPK